MMFLLMFACVQVSHSLTLAVDPCGSPGWPVPSPPEGLTLKQVIAVIRHGDRTVWNGSQCWPGDKSIWSCDLSKFELPTYWPTQYQDTPIPRLFQKIYTSSIYNEDMLGNCSLGQLTSKGYTQHLANGKSLHDAYVKSGFLKDPLDPSEVYLRSDDVPRTLQSAQSLILGMFPVDSSYYSGTSATPSIPLHTRDRMYDNIEYNPILCPKAGLYTQKFRSSDIWKKHSSTTKMVLQKIKNTTGVDVDEDQLSHFADCLCTHLCHNMSMPKGMTKELYDAVGDEMSWQYYASYKYPTVEENAKVSIGFLLKDIWKNLNDSVMGKSVQKFLLYSGHDTTVMPILVALKVDDGIWSPYASMILMELYENKDKKSLMRFVYNGKVLSPPSCGSDNLCEYEALSAYLAKITPPDDYKKFCL